MPEIKFDTGLVTYTINGTCEVTFNPTDTNFVENLFSTLKLLDEIQDTQQEQAESDVSNTELFQGSRERDQAMRETLDKAFGVPVSEALFGGMNLYALADGLPVWMNLILAVIEEAYAATGREFKRTDARISKYTAKYKKRK